MWCGALLDIMLERVKAIQMKRSTVLTYLEHIKDLIRGQGKKLSSIEISLAHTFCDIHHL
jgi:hypothetical protein